jgi:outer membrane protein OmpA-like peptidoglycan-associated protein
MGLIRNDPYAGEGACPTFNLEFAADTTLAKKFAIGGNIGYRLRNPGTKRAGFPVEPRGNQIIGSGAFSYLLPWADTKIITELYGSWPEARRTLNTDRSQTTFEWLLGLKHDANRNLALHVGGGTKVANGVASPDWRVYAGLNYVFGSLWGEPKPLIRKVTPQYKIDDDGPGEAVTPFWQEPVETTEVFVADDILFGFGSDRVVNQGARDALAQLNDHMLKPPKMKLLVIEGHTDSIGSEVYNKDLSQRRASNIRKYMIENLGVDPKAVKAIGIGEERPIADNGNFQGRAKNRRVEFKIYREGSTIPEELRR